MYSNFDSADNIMNEKGFDGINLVNLFNFKEWTSTKSEVLVFSRPKDTESSSGNFQFELNKNIISSINEGIYNNYFFSDNLKEIAKQTYCFFKESSNFPLKEKEEIKKIYNFSLTDDILYIDQAKLRKNGDRFILSQFNKLERNIFINFITNFKIKLYKHRTSNEYVFFWLLNNYIISEQARNDLNTRYKKYLTSGENVINTREIYESLIEIYEKIELKNIPKNLIVYGSPGTGKSYYLDNIAGCSPNMYTVTFHPDYDYSDFIGTYKPKSIICKDDTQDTNMCKSKVIYTFVPGILIKVIKKAIENPDENIILKIEEINRGNTATIFGDIFQLLDRNEDGESKYSIEASDEIYDFLKVKKIKIPKNLYILATMNTSDQSLYPMDSAFKRRWTWKHIPIDLNDAKKLTITIDDITDINWSDFIEKINKKILNITDSEDKQLGNRFVNPLKNEINIDTFVGKVLFYLWSDIFKHEDHFDENNIFKSLKEDINSSSEKISFSLLYNTDGTVNIEILKKLLKDLEFLV